jgi:transposase
MSCGQFQPAQHELAKRLLDEGQSAKQVAKTFGVHVATVYRVMAT